MKLGSSRPMRTKSAMCAARTTPYAHAKSKAASSNAPGTQSAATSSAAIAAKITMRTAPSSGSTTLVSQAYPTQDHQRTPRTRRPRASPCHVGVAAIKAVHCVIARTKTRSKKSSSGVTRSPWRRTALKREVAATPPLCTAGDLALRSGAEFRGAFRVGPDARRARRIHALDVEEIVQTSTARTEPDPRRWWALALLCGAFYMVILDAAIVTVALPSIEEELGFSAQGLQWVVSAYALTFAGLLLLGGRAADLLGRRRVFMVGIVLFTLASLLCGLAWSDDALIGAPAFQGVGAGVRAPTALSIITTTFEEGPERNKALGIWGALGGIGATTAWLIGGPIVDALGWEWIFFINIPVGLAALALSPLLLRESRAATVERSYDPAGGLTRTGSL